MLLGSGNLLNKLPLTQLGGVINNTNWTNPSIAMAGVDTFDNKSSLPNGYGGKAFYLPMKAGGISVSDFVGVSIDANMNNVQDAVAIQNDVSLGALANIGVSDSVLVTTSCSLRASGHLSITDAVNVNLNGSLILSISASIDDTITFTIAGTMGAFVSAYVNDVLQLSIDGVMVGSISASMDDTVYFSTNSPVLLADAVMQIDDSVVVTMGVSVKANGFMFATMEQSTAALTAKDVWEYYQRTLTSGTSGGESFTLEQIADAVWAKVLP